jgi:hypothetical protein
MGGGGGGGGKTALTYHLAPFYGRRNIGRIMMEYAFLHVGFPFTEQTRYVNFVMWFGMFYWTTTTLVNQPYPANPKAKKP